MQTENYPPEELVREKKQTGEIPASSWWLPIKIWILTIAVFGPLFFWLLSYKMESPLVTNPNNFSIIPVVIFFGLALSLPTLIITVVIYAFLIKRVLTHRNRLFIICALSVTGCLATFALIDVDLTEDIVMSYCLAVLVSTVLSFRRQSDGIRNSGLRNTSQGH